MLQTFLITWVTHSARISERMRMYEDKIVEDRENNPRLGNGQPVELSVEDEIEVMGYLTEIMQQDDLKVLAMNICCDHVHLVIVCEEMELVRIIQKLKGGSSFRFGKKRMRSDKATLVPGNHNNTIKTLVGPLWAQKFNRVELPDEIAVQNACQYVYFNRQKHGLTKNEFLENIIQSVLTHPHDIG